MNDYDKFRKFFQKMGVAYHKYHHKKSAYGCCGRRHSEPRQSFHCLTVSQADFCFNRRKRYIGVISDEMGYYERRNKK